MSKASNGIPLGRLDLLRGLCTEVSYFGKIITSLEILILSFTCPNYTHFWPKGEIQGGLISSHLMVSLM